MVAGSTPHNTAQSPVTSTTHPTSRGTDATERIPLGHSKPRKSQRNTTDNATNSREASRLRRLNKTERAAHLAIQAEGGVLATEHFAPSGRFVSDRR